MTDHEPRRSTPTTKSDGSELEAGGGGGWNWPSSPGATSRSEASSPEGTENGTRKPSLLDTNPADRMHTLSDVTWDWKFHRDEVLMEVFKMCDKDGDEKLAEKEMGRALRLLGLNITEPQIREMIIEQNTSKGKLDYKQFVNALEAAIGSWSVYEDLRLAFSVFETGDSGMANKAELKEHLTMLGDPLDEDEAEDWLSLVAVNSQGMLNYQHLIKAILQKEGLWEQEKQEIIQTCQP